jgi:hypothetical protein
MNTQNMTVLTVEFTRIPLFLRAKMPLNALATPPVASLDAQTSHEVPESTPHPFGRRTFSAATKER